MNKKDNIQSISLTPTHGTARQVTISSIIPKIKEDKEVFWVEKLLNKIQKKYKEAYSNPDDSDGNHDVIIDFDKNILGVQVTELTYELERARMDIKRKYIEKIKKEVLANKIVSKNKILVNIFFSAIDIKKPTLVRAEEVAKTVMTEVKKFTSDKSVKTPFGKILIQQIKSGQLYTSCAGNIGFDVNFDQVPRSLPFYKETINSIVEKKSKSKSEWLLIWSLDFWRDKDWLEDEVIDHMKKSFVDTSFKKVYFAESLNGEGLFQANLKIVEIK